MEASDIAPRVHELCSLPPSGNKSEAPLDSGIRAPQDGTAMQQSLSKRLAEIVIPDSDGREVRLGSLWATSPAVIVFLRHYG
jgi:hypothetical protein